MALNHLSQVIVIESLFSRDAKTGRVLFEYIKAIIESNNLPLSVKFEVATDKKNFFQILDSVLHSAQSTGEYPLIHIECHGSQDETGIVLSNDDFISWAELKPILTKINIATRCNLLMVLGACNGAHLVEVLQINDRAPCWGVLGPAESVFPDDLMSSYRLFYGELFSSLDGDVALSKLFSSPIRKANYCFVTAQNFFITVYSRYLDENCSQRAYWARAKSMNAKLIKEGTTAKSLQSHLAWFKRTEKDYFEKYKTHFFMTDLYPENLKRFNVNYKEIKAMRAGQ